MTHADKDQEKVVGIVKEIHAECVHLTDSDRCELSAKIMECVHDAARKRNLDVKKLL